MRCSPAARPGASRSRATRSRARLAWRSVHYANHACCCSASPAWHWHSSTTLAWLSLALGLLIAAFLLINEFPDYRADRAGAKRNLVVRLGRGRAARLYLLLAGLAYLVPVWLTATQAKPWLLGALLGLPASCWAGGRLLRESANTARIVPAQAATLIAFLLFALGAGSGSLLGG